MDIHNAIMNIHNLITVIYNCNMGTHNYIFYFQLMLSLMQLLICMNGLWIAIIELRMSII